MVPLRLRSEEPCSVPDAPFLCVNTEELQRVKWIRETIYHVISGSQLRTALECH